jgi:hypothetical protein
MRHPSQMDVLSIAVQVAEAGPQRMVGCPICAADVRGANLGRHLGDKHPGADCSPPWTGIDRRVRRTLTAGIATGFVVAAIVALLDRAAKPVFGHLPWAAVIVLVVVLAALGGYAILSAAHPRARLSLTDQGVELRYALGLQRHVVPLPSPLAAGKLQRVPLGGGGPENALPPSTPVAAGTYLAIGSGRRGVVVGSPTATGLRKHWTGWEKGPVRRRWDITLDPGDAVALEYALHDRGLLVVSKE